MSEVFSDLMKDIPFEKMSQASIRALCEAGMRNIDAACYSMKRKSVTDLDKSIIDEITNVNPAYVPAMWRLISSTSGSEYWKKYNTDKKCVLALLNLFVTESAVGYTFSHSDSLISNDIHPSVLKDKDVINFILENKNTFIKRFPHQGNIFGSMDKDTIISLLHEDFSLACKVIASCPLLIGRIMSSHRPSDLSASNNLSTEDARKMLMCVVDQLGSFQNYSPAILRNFWDHNGKEACDKELFNDIFMYLCQCCANSGDENMALIEKDMNHYSNGGKARRNQTQGWVRDYFFDQYTQGNGRFVLEVVKTLPLMFNLLSCHIQNNAKFRSLKRMYQLSGDVKK